MVNSYNPFMYDLMKQTLIFRIRTVRVCMVCLMLIMFHFIVGCDVGIRGTQTVQFTVLDLRLHQPATGARVTCAPLRRVPSTLDALSRDDYCQLFDAQGGYTNINGEVDVRWPIVAAKSGLLVWMGIERVILYDTIMGSRFIVSVRAGTIRESLDVPMAPETSVSGDHFTVTVNAIGQPIPD